MNAKKYSAWTERERAILAENYPTLGARPVAAMLGRPYISVKYQAQRYGISCSGFSRNGMRFKIKPKARVLNPLYVRDPIAADFNGWLRQSPRADTPPMAWGIA